MPTYVITTSPEGNSVSNYFFGIGKALHKRGHQVVIITDQNKPHLLPSDEEGKYHYSWPNRRPTGIKDFLFFMRLCRKHKPDCVIGNFGAQSVVLIVGILAGVKHRVVYWHTMLGQIEADRKRRKIWHKLLLLRKKYLLKLFATHIFTNSETNRQELATYFKFPAERIHKFYLLIPDPMNGKERVTKRENIISFVGRLDKSKRQDILVREVTELHKHLPDLKVYIVGRGSEEQNLKLIAKEQETEDIIHFTGRVPLIEVYRIMGMSKVHVSASIEEAFGLVNAEALGVGTPIVATEVGGLKEILINGYNGLYFNPNDKTDLTEKIISIINGDWERYSCNARQSFLDRFSNANMEEQVERYEQLFGKN